MVYRIPAILAREGRRSQNAKPQSKKVLSPQSSVLSPLYISHAVIRCSRNRAAAPRPDGHRLHARGVAARSARVDNRKIRVLTLRLEGPAKMKSRQNAPGVGRVHVVPRIVPRNGQDCRERCAVGSESWPAAGGARARPRIEGRIDAILRRMSLGKKASGHPGPDRAVKPEDVKPIISDIAERRRRLGRRCAHGQANRLARAFDAFYAASMDALEWQTSDPDPVGLRTEFHGPTRSSARRLPAQHRPRRHAQLRAHQAHREITAVEMSVTESIELFSCVFAMTRDDRWDARTKRTRRAPSRSARRRSSSRDSRGRRARASSRTWKSDRHGEALSR